MLAILGLLSAVAGAAVAALSTRFPQHADRLQTGAGVMLIAGLALASQALPVML
jgi:hypothetical protein